MAAGCGPAEGRPPAVQQVAQLCRLIAGYGPVLVAFSGGVDSGVVLAAAVRALGTGGVAALTAASPAVPASEMAAARRFAADLGVRHLVRAAGEWRMSGYRENGPTRCYFCKSALLDLARAVRAELRLAAVLTGTNASDLGDYRPGIAAAAERGARTPLLELGLTKPEVRAVAGHLGLGLADKPASPCLASRIAYGVPVTPWRLARVERAEAAIRTLVGPRLTELRVRDLGDRVRIEVDAALVGYVRDLAGVREAVRAAGFEVRVSVAAYRTGALNDALSPGRNPQSRPDREGDTR
jgi:pyridinium-3,5-biscarboxylic acid mononucleotide sulfurtransferase